MTDSADQRDEFVKSDLTDSANAPSIKNLSTKKKKESDVVYVDPEIERLCTLLAELVRANGHKAMVSDAWRRECDRLMRLDGYSADQVEWVMRWATQRSPFWSTNIRSMPKLREKFSTLKGQALAEHERVKSRPTPREATQDILDIGARLQAEVDGQLAVTR